MYMLSFIFIKRDWHQDKPRIRAVFESLIQARTPVWIGRWTAALFLLIPISDT